MKQALKHKLKRLDRNLPVRELALLPAEAFIYRIIDIPAEMPAAERGGYVQLQLEAISPFPVETLAWGYLWDGKEQALVYAATLERAAPESGATLESLWNAYPAFLPFCLGWEGDRDLIRICVAGHCACALYFKNGSTLPQRIVSRPLPATFTPDQETLPETHAELLKILNLENTSELEHGFWLLDGKDCSAEERVSFDLRHICEGREDLIVKRTLSGDAHWDADARGRTHAAKARKDRRTSYALWLTLCGAGGFAALLLLAQVFVLICHVLTSHYKSVARQNQKQVETLQNESDFANNLDSVTDRQMKPFAMLAVANRKRPGPLYMERASAGDWNVLRIEGLAQRAEQVQNYIETLSKDPDVSEVRNVRTSSTGGRTSFDIEIVFNSLYDLKAAQ